MIGCEHEKLAADIANIIGTKVKFPTEQEIPMTFLGIVSDYNGVDIIQTRNHVEISCANYIDRIMKSHGWSTAPNTEKLKAPVPPEPSMMVQTQPLNHIATTTSNGIDQATISAHPSDIHPDGNKPIAPLAPDCIKTMYSDDGPKEGTVEHTVLEKQQGFGYRTLLGEMMYAYVTCRLDIGYAITTLSKFSTAPSTYHYGLLKSVAKYLRKTRSWGIRFKQSAIMPDFPEEEPQDVIQLPDSIGPFPVDIAQPVLTCFVDAAHANDLRKRRSTTGYVLMFAGGAVVYKSKTQTLTAGSSTEAEFIAAYSAAKSVRYIRYVLKQMGFIQKDPTIIYIDNESALKIINDNQSPTARTRHMDIRFFAIQDWKNDGDIIMKHIKGILNPSDDLTKPLGWVLHSRHCRRMMGHY